MAAELNGYLESYGYTQFTVGLTDPMKGRLPMLIISIIYFGIFAIKFTPDEPVVKTMEMEVKKVAKGNLSNFAEIAAIVIFFGDALALMFAKKLGLDSWEITVIGALLMILTNVLKPKEAAQSLPLNILFLIVGSNAIAGALSNTGAGEFIGNNVIKLVNVVGMHDCP